MHWGQHSNLFNAEGVGPDGKGFWAEGPGLATVAWLTPSSHAHSTLLLYQSYYPDPFVFWWPLQARKWC